MVLFPKPYQVNSNFKPLFPDEKSLEISQSVNELLEYLSFYWQLEWQKAEAVRCSQWCLGGRIILAQAGVEAEDEAVPLDFFCVKNGSET